MRFLLEQGVPADSILMLTPQRTMQEPFLDLLYSPERAAGGAEQDEPGHDEHAEERVQLVDLRQEQGDEPEGRADGVDDEHRVAVREPEIEQPVVDVGAVRAER